MTTPPLDLPALKGWIESGIPCSPEHAIDLIDRVTAAESSLARYIVERTRFGDAMAASAVAPVVDAIMRELTADSNARTTAAEAAIARVREVHPESIAYPLLPGGTPDLKAAPIGRVCLTCSDESIEWNLDDGEWSADDSGNVFYPCPTITALDVTP